MTTLLFFLITAPAEGRALWVWQPDLLPEARNFFEFCATLKTNTIFLSVGNLNGRDLRPFLKEAAVRNIQVEALLGTPEWVLEPAGLLKRISWLLKFNRENPDACFVGLHLDIEPYTLPEWRDAQRHLIENYLRVIRGAKEAIGDIYLTIDIPYWFSSIIFEWQGKKKPLSQHLLDIVDRVSIMDYTVDQNRLITNVLNDLEYADRVGKGVWIGINFNPEAQRSTTFYRLKRGEVEGMLKRADKTFAQHPSFLGFAYHDYHSYRAWLSK